MKTRTLGMIIVVLLLIAAVRVLADDPEPTPWITITDRLYYGIGPDGLPQWGVSGVDHPSGDDNNNAFWTQIESIYDRADYGETCRCEIVDDAGWCVKIACLSDLPDDHSFLFTSEVGPTPTTDPSCPEGHLTDPTNTPRATPGPAPTSTPGPSPTPAPYASPTPIATRGPVPLPGDPTFAVECFNILRNPLCEIRVRSENDFPYHLELITPLVVSTLRNEVIPDGSDYHLWELDLIFNTPYCSLGRPWARFYFKTYNRIMAMDVFELGCIRLPVVEKNR